MNYQSLLASLRITGVYHLPAGTLQDIVRAAEANGCTVFRVDLQGAGSKGEALQAIAQALRFPAWFGGNLDALADSLGELTDGAGAGCVLILEHGDGLHGKAAADFAELLRVFSRAADEWRAQGRPFWCFVELLADGIAWLPTLG